jgi:hypothetical protein
MENRIDSFERSGACTRGAKPSEGRGELGGGNAVSHPRLCY